MMLLVVVQVQFSLPALAACGPSMAKCSGTRALQAGSLMWVLDLDYIIRIIRLSTMDLYISVQGGVTPLSPSPPAQMQKCGASSVARDGQDCDDTLLAAVWQEAKIC